MSRRPQRRAVSIAAVGGVALGLLLGGCAAGPQTRQQQTSEAQKSACRKRANEVYAKQNRDELYNSDTYQSDTRDSPFSTSGLPGITTRGLGGEYARENLVSDCLDDAAGNVGNSANDTPPVATGTQSTPGRLPRTLSPLAVPPPSSP